MNIVETPALALFVKESAPSLPAESTAVEKPWVMPELFVIPLPLSVNANRGSVVIVKALAPELNMIALTSTLGNTSTLVRLLPAKVATSLGPFGTVIGTQLALLPHVLDGGLADHVALAARLASPLSQRIEPLKNAAMATDRHLDQTENWLFSDRPIGSVFITRSGAAALRILFVTRGEDFARNAFHLSSTKPQAVDIFRVRALAPPRGAAISGKWPGLRRGECRAKRW
jgi:hypothetical protein